MPVSRTKELNLLATTSPIVTGAMAEEAGVEYDHLCLFIDFTLGSLTSIDIKLQFSIDGATWYDAYAADKTLISVGFSASFSGAIYFGVGSAAATRMQPAIIAAPLWRLYVTTNGTTTSSSLKVDCIPFTVGHLRL